MTNENEKLSVAELKQRLLKLKPREALWVELRERGLPTGRVDDAIRLIGAEHSSEKGGWTTPGDSRPRSVSEIADEFETEREYMFRDTRSAQRKSPDDGPRIEDDRAYFKDGSSLPTELLSTDDLFALAGQAPKPVAPEPKSDGDDDEHLSDLDKDWRDAGTPKAAS